MKLFTKYSRINVISTVFIFLLGCIAFSMLLRYVIISQVDEDLRIEKNEVVNYVDRFGHLPSVIEVHDQYTTYKIIPKPQTSIKKIYTHKAYDAGEHEKESRRTIEFDIEANNAWYLVSVSKSLEGSDELIQTIIAITITIILLILIAAFLINRFVLVRLWKPFYSTLQTMQRFNLRDTQAIDFINTDIDEFKYLNSILHDALSKAQHDYQTLKEFTENASHELQTPLAIIQSKLDILIQNEKLSRGESEAIQSAYTALQNLSRLNQSLLLLAKIENNQFSEQTKIDIKELLQNKINEFNELWKNRNISVETDLLQKEITGNIYLTEILLNNLLSNATKHNVQNGFVIISLNNNLQITNTGVTHALDEKKFYKRFSRQSNATANGLGLSIIHQICIASGYTCTYNFQSPNIHSFTVSFH
ncbi:MAG: HAMP domain-containing sensor histidine kinase [Parafilimonas sp.]